MTRTCAEDWLYSQGQFKIKDSNELRRNHFILFHEILSFPKYSPILEPLALSSDPTDVDSSDITWGHSRTPACSGPISGVGTSIIKNRIIQQEQKENIWIKTGFLFCLFCGFTTTRLGAAVENNKRITPNNVDVSFYMWMMRTKPWAKHYFFRGASRFMKKKKKKSKSFNLLQTGEYFQQVRIGVHMVRHTRATESNRLLIPLHMVQIRNTHILMVQ